MMLLRRPAANSSVSATRRRVIARSIATRAFVPIATRRAPASSRWTTVLSRHVASRRFSVAAIVRSSRFEVVQEHPEGLLLSPTYTASDESSSSSPSISRGVVVDHNGAQWVCIFQVDAYWFAAPLLPPSVSTSSSSACSANGSIDTDAAAVCLHRPTPTQNERAQLAECVSTGILSVDTLAPIGLGQSMLVCGPSRSGNSLLSREVMEHALKSGRFQKVIRFQSDAATSENPEGTAGAFADLVVPAASSPALHLAPLFAAIGSAEAVMYAGGHALLVLDTLAPALAAWDLALSWAEAAKGEPLGSESVSSQRRGFFSNITERASKMLEGGSLTLVGIVETEEMRSVLTPSASAKLSPESRAKLTEQAGDFALADFADRREKDQQRLKLLVDRGIPLTEATLKTLGIPPPIGKAGRQGGGEAAVRELQSLSDGQIVLEGDGLDVLDGSERWLPVVEPGASFSRFGLGSSGREASDQSVPKPEAVRDVRPAALSAVAAHLRVHLALEREAHFRPAEDPDGVDGMQSGHMEAVRAAFRQPARAALTAEEMTVLLLSACSGALDTLSQTEVAAVLSGGAGAPLLKHLREGYPAVLQRIGVKGKVDAQVARELDVAVRLFVALRKASSQSAAAQ